MFLSSNPAAGAARFTLERPRSGPARADVIDLLGRRVHTLLDAPMLSAGSHVVNSDFAAMPWDAAFNVLVFKSTATPGPFEMPPTGTLLPGARALQGR